MTTTQSYLTKGLPDSRRLYDYDLVFNTDFRNWIRYEELMLSTNDEDLDAIEILTLCFKDGVNILNEIDIESAFDSLLWFFTIGEEKEKPKENIPEEDDKENVVKPKAKIIYSYKYDWEYIYSAFMQCYGLDLFTCSLHWWQFKALFNSLSEDTQFVKILGYRSMTISSNMSKEEKRRIRKMKKIYGLPDTRSEEEKETSFARSMFNTMKD